MEILLYKNITPLNNRLNICCVFYGWIPSRPIKIRIEGDIKVPTYNQSTFCVRFIFFSVVIQFIKKVTLIWSFIRCVNIKEQKRHSKFRISGSAYAHVSTHSYLSSHHNILDFQCSSKRWLQRLHWTPILLVANFSVPVDMVENLVVLSPLLDAILCPV